MSVPPPKVPTERILEAVLMASDQPISLTKLSQLLPNASSSDIQQALETLQKDCEHRSITLTAVASGWRYQVKQTYAQWVQDLWQERPPRYSRAVREILALIVYRQPITRAEMAKIRGVSVRKPTLDILSNRGWIKIMGYRDLPGKPALYGTTQAFLDDFNLKDLKSLPKLEDILE